MLKATQLVTLGGGLLPCISYYLPSLQRRLEQETAKASDMTQTLVEHFLCANSS